MLAALSSPVCDAKGIVDMNAMTERARNSHLSALAVGGIELRSPMVRKVS